MPLGITVRTLRKSRGLSLAEVEQITHVNKSALSRFERGLEGLGSKNFHKLCATFGTTPSVLYAVARLASKKPILVEDGRKLNNLVKGLTRLIDNYLSSSEEMREQIDEILSEDRTRHYDAVVHQ